MKTSKFKLCEIFHSIQGEGREVGKPSVFIRFFGCNFQCSWCDTKYSWDPKEADFFEIDLESIIEKIRSFSPTKHVIFTGGEPLLFQEKIRLIRKKLQEKKLDHTHLGPNNYTFEVETNGSQKIEDDFWDTINISPKTKNSGMGEYPILAYEKKNSSEKKGIQTEKSDKNIQNTWFKFVVEGESDIPEILAIQKKYNIPHEKIFLMPQAQTKKTLEKISPKIVDLALKYNFLFCGRLHVWLYSDQKGY